MQINGTQSAMDKRVIVHYPKDGITYMKGECGSNSISSTKNKSDVTCQKCKEILEKIHGINWSDYE